MLGLLLAPNAFMSPPARAAVGVRRAPEASMLTRRELATSAGAALLAMGTFSGAANAVLPDRSIVNGAGRKADQKAIGVSSVPSTHQPLKTDCPRPCSHVLATDAELPLALRQFPRSG